jgi:hypothetical protein
MIVHLAKLLNQGDINERAYELAVKQLVLNTPPTGESKGSPSALNSGGKYSSNRKVSVPPLPSREGDVKGGEWKGMTSCLEHNTPSTATKSIDGKGKEPMYPLPTSTIEDNKSYNEDDKELYFDDELDELINRGPYEGFDGEVDYNEYIHLGEHEAPRIEESRRTPIWQGERISFESRQEAVKYIKHLPYKYVQLYHWKKDTIVYGCSTHLACPSKIRMKKEVDGEGYNIQYNEDDHSSTVTDYPPSKGLPQLLRAEVDRRILATDTPFKIYCDLLNHDDFKDCVTTMDRHEFLKCVRNRKQHMTRLQGGPNLLENCADLMNWAAAHTFPEAVDNFFACDNSKLHVLHTGYRQDVKAVVFSSLKLTQNILKAQYDRPYNFTLMVDGTHKLQYGSWILITCGVLSIRWSPSNSGLSQTFQPVAYCFCETESEAAAALLLESVQRLCFRYAMLLTG